MKNTILILSAIAFIAGGCGQATQKDQKNGAKDTLQSDTSKTLITSNEVSAKRSFTINDSSYVYIKLINEKINQVKKTLATSDASQANQLYLQTDTLLMEYVKALESMNMNWLDEYAFTVEDSLPANVKQLIAQLKECSVQPRDIGEGMSELVYTPFFHYNLFKDHVSKDFRDYIKIRACQDTILFAADAGIIVPWEVVSSYAMDWETFMKKHPSSFFKDKAAEAYSFYMNVFLFGSDNTPVFDYSTQTIDKDIRLVFDKFLKKYPNSNSAKILKFYLEEVKNNSGKMPDDLWEKVNKFMEELR